MTVKLPYVTQDRDSRGNVRLYYRRNGVKLRLRGPVGSSDFIVDYQMAMSGHDPKERGKPVLSSTKSGSIRDLIGKYYLSSSYHALAPRTRRVRQQILDRFCQNKNDGDKPYALLEPRHIMLRRDAMVDRPEAANGMIKALRQVYSFAVEYGYHDVNPIKEVSLLAGSVDGFKAWSEEDVKAFEDQHPIGTMARLTMALALYTGQRRGDLIRLGPRHIKSHHGREGLEFVQHKNRNRPGRKVSLWVPIIPELRTIIDASKTGNSTFILTEFGRPFSGDGFGNRFRKWCSDAGLVGLSVHGLRKTAAAVLAENGCTEQEIMAITGHRTSKEVTRYTQSAKQKTRANSALNKVSKPPKDEGDANETQKENTQ